MRKPIYSLILGFAALVATTLVQAEQANPQVLFKTEKGDIAISEMNSDTEIIIIIARPGIIIIIIFWGGKKGEFYS